MRSRRAWAACVAVVAAAVGVGCSGAGGAGAEARPDPAAAVALRLQGEWEGPCAAVGTGSSQLDRYQFTGRDLRFSTWAFPTPDCSGTEGLLANSGSGVFAIGASLTASVSGAFEVPAWRLEVTWSTSAVARTAVALADPRDPLPFVLFAAWDGEGVSSSLVPTPYRRAGQPAYDFGAELQGGRVRCVSATRAEYRSFWSWFGGYDSGNYDEAGRDVAACDPRQPWGMITDGRGGVYELGRLVPAGLDGALVMGHVVRTRVGVWRTQTAFIASGDGGTLYLSELAYEPAEPVVTISGAGWVRPSAAERASHAGSVDAAR